MSPKRLKLFYWLSKYMCSRVVENSLVGVPELVKDWIFGGLRQRCLDMLGPIDRLELLSSACTA